MNHPLQSEPPCSVEVEVYVYMGKLPSPKPQMPRKLGMSLFLTFVDVEDITKYSLGPFSGHLSLNNVLSTLVQKQMVTFNQKPHFYQSLPRRSTDYGDDFIRQALPFNSTLKNLRIADSDRVTLEVLLNRNSRIEVKCRESTRVFDNIWKPGPVAILKGATHLFASFSALTLPPPSDEHGFLEAAGRIPVEDEGDWNALIEQAVSMGDPRITVRPNFTTTTLALNQREPGGEDHHYYRLYEPA
jgi:hypothetical protein